ACPTPWAGTRGRPRSASAKALASSARRPGRGPGRPSRPGSDPPGRRLLFACLVFRCLEVEGEPEANAVHLVVELDGRVVAGGEPVASRITADQLHVELLLHDVLNGGEPLIEPVVVDDSVLQDVVLVHVPR